MDVSYNWWDVGIGDPLTKVGERYNSQTFIIADEDKQFDGTTIYTDLDGSNSESDLGGSNGVDL